MASTPALNSAGFSQEVYGSIELSAGTAAIGKLAANSGVDIGDVDVTSIAAGENIIGKTGKPADVISVTPTVSTAPAYTSGDAVGGKQTLTSAARVSGGQTKLTALTVVDKGNQKAAITLLFFNADPTAATITDNAAFAFSTDISKVVAKLNVAAADYETVDSKAIATLRGLDLIMEASGSAHLYVAAVTTGTPTYASTSDLIFYYGFEQA